MNSFEVVQKRCCGLFSFKSTLFVLRIDFEIVLMRLWPINKVVKCLRTEIARIQAKIIIILLLWLLAFMLSSGYFISLFTMMTTARFGFMINFDACGYSFVRHLMWIFQHCLCVHQLLEKNLSSHYDNRNKTITIQTTASVFHIIFEYNTPTTWAFTMWTNGTQLGYSYFCFFFVCMHADTICISYSIIMFFFFFFSSCYFFFQTFCLFMLLKMK